MNEKIVVSNPVYQNLRTQTETISILVFWRFSGLFQAVKGLNNVLRRSWLSYKAYYVYSGLTLWTLTRKVHD